MKKKTILVVLFILLLAGIVCADPGFSILNVTIRDSRFPCNPYASTSHNFAVFVFNCNLTISRAQWLTGIGPGGGRIYGEVKVPEGSYLVVAAARCANVITNWAYVNVCCGKEECVNLIPRSFARCLYEFRTAAREALRTPAYPFGTPVKENDKAIRAALEKTAQALEELNKYFPIDIEIPIDRLNEADTPEQMLKLFEKK